jgi:tetratricopeptide (TPR) repeat protein
MVTPPGEQNLVDGMRLLFQGDQNAASIMLEKANDHPDAAWMAGILRLKQEDFAAAKAHLEHVLSRLEGLGALFEKYDIAPQANLPIADGVFAHIRSRERGTRLALVELAEATGDLGAAMVQLDRLLEIDADDPVVILSFCQIAMDHADDPALAGRVIEMSANITNDTPIHTGIMLYRARALAARGLPDAAITVLTQAGRRRKDRPEGLLHQIRFDRAELYDQVGRKAQARREYEKLYAEFPGFPGLSERLGLA